MYVFEQHYTQADKQTFLEKVKSVSFKLGINPNWLMYLMFRESGLNPQSYNKYYKFTDCGGGYAGGLIGFVPCTQQALGWTKGWEAFKNQSGADQMDYVYRFYDELHHASGKIKSFGDLRLLAFYPAYLGKPPETQFPEEVVRANPVFDINKDGKLTIGEFYESERQWVQKNVPAQYQAEFFEKTGEPIEYNYVQRHERDILVWGAVVVFLIMIGVVAFLILKK